MSDDFFAELDAEIAKHAQRSQIRKSAEAARKIAMNKAVNEVKRLTALREWRELQAVIDTELWRPVASVALFTEQVCDGCGSVHKTFLQYMQQEVLRSKPTDRRLVRVTKPEPALPRAVLIRSHTTHICSDCCDDHGFLIDDAISLPSTEALTISTNYFQGDINAEAEESGSAEEGIAIPS